MRISGQLTQEKRDLHTFFSILFIVDFQISPPLGETLVALGHYKEWLKGCPCLVAITLNYIKGL